MLGILSGRDEGTLFQANAGRLLETVAREADVVLLVDNDTWRSTDESVVKGYTSVNERIARRFGLLLTAGEVTEAETMVDSSEVINPLRGGGIAAVGIAAAAASEDADANVSTVTSVTHNALLTGTSLPDAADAESALLVVAGRPEAISRKGIKRAIVAGGGARDPGGGLGRPAGRPGPAGCAGAPGRGVAVSVGC